MKAQLINEKLPFQIVEFDFNPETLTGIRKQASASNPDTGAGRGATPSIFLRAPARTLTGNGYLVGDDVEMRTKQLYDWMDPGGGLIGSLIGMGVSALTGGRINLAAKAPVLIFQWGSQLMRCILKSLQVDYERFRTSGAVDRAKVSFTVQEEFNIFGMFPTNPTSGGLPGRQRHVVSHGETVHSLSTGAYGKPNLWRGVADANGIDDPFRVRPGDTVYLPNPNEIIGKR